MSKLRAIGISNFNEKQYLDFIRKCEVIPAINQVEAHVFYGQKRLQTVMAQYGTHMEARSPFAAGKSNFFENKTLCMLGQKYGKSTAQIGLRFLIEKGIIVIPKTSHKERLKENQDIFDFELSDEDIKQLETLDKAKYLFILSYIIKKIKVNYQKRQKIQSNTCKITAPLLLTKNFFIKNKKSPSYDRHSKKFFVVHNNDFFRKVVDKQI